MPTRSAHLSIDLAGFVACALLAAAWYFLGLSPLSEARDSRVQLTATLAQLEEKQATLLQARSTQAQRLADVESQISRASTTLQPADQINARVKHVSDVAMQSGLRIDEIRPGTPTRLEHYTAVPIRLAGQGGYAAAAAFLHAIHESDRDLGVTGLDLRAEPEAADKPATFVIQLLWFAAPETSPRK